MRIFLLSIFSLLIFSTNLYSKSTFSEVRQSIWTKDKIDSYIDLCNNAVSGNNKNKECECIVVSMAKYFEPSEAQYIEANILDLIRVTGYNAWFPQYFKLKDWINDEEINSLIFDLLTCCDCSLDICKESISFLLNASENSAAYEKTYYPEQIAVICDINESNNLYYWKKKFVKGLGILLPETKFFRRLQNDSMDLTMNIAVTKDGIIIADTQSVKINELSKSVSLRLNENPTLLIHLHIDRRCTMEIVHKIHSELTKASAFKIRYATK